MLEGGTAGRTHELENSTVLQAERGAYRQHALHETTSLGGMRSVADLAHYDAMTDLLFGNVVRRFYPFDVDEGPEGVAVLEQLGARLAGLGVGEGRPLSEQGLKATLERSHVHTKGRSR